MASAGPGRGDEPEEHAKADQADEQKAAKDPIDDAAAADPAAAETEQQLSAQQMIWRARNWLLFSVVGGLLYGYNVSLGASLQYIRDELQLTTAQQEFVSASATLTDAVSMVIGGRLADLFGRRPTAMAAAGCSVVGCLMASCFSHSFAGLVTWRFATGIGNGVSILLLPMYISECVDSRQRGLLVTLFQLGVVSGCCLPYLFMIFVSESWRSCLALGAVPGMYIFYNFFWHFGESTKWLKWKTNMVSTSVVNGTPTPNDSAASTPSAIDMELAETRPLKDLESDTDKAATSCSSPSSSSSSLASDPSRPHHPHLELGIGIMLAYVNNSIDPSLFYGPEIISKALNEFSRRDANVFGLLCSLLSVVAVVVAFCWLVERFSRRRIYLLCLLVVTLCFFVSGVLFDILDPSHPDSNLADKPLITWAIVATFSVLVVCSSIGPGTIFVVILSELFTSNEYRAKYMSYCTFTMSLVSLLVNGTMLSLFNALGTANTFYGYGLSYALCLGFLWRFLPETKRSQVI